MAKYYVANAFGLEAGSQIGLLMSVKLKAAGGRSEDIKDELISTDFGFNLGAGYDVAANINIGLRYSLGLSNIWKDSGDFKINSNTIAFAVGYKF